MSEENPTPSTNQQSTDANQNNEDQSTTTTTTTTAADVTASVAAAAAASSPPSTPGASQPSPRPLPSQTFDTAAFMEVYDCAKLNNSWNKVSSALALHPDWLTKIPENRRWTMLHQIVFSGDINHLNNALALQINNSEFRLLCKTADNKTVREVAAERAHMNPQMLRRIERLVAIDQLLNNAKERKWDLVKQCISLQPDIVNEKPPYRRFYLAHHLAYVGELNMFKELSKHCHFKLDLVADDKTISQTAREHNHIPFAEYVESLTTQATEDSSALTSAAAAANNNNEDDDDDDTAPYPTGGHHYSPGFYEDPGISFIPANLNLNNIFPNSNHYHHHHHFPSSHSYSYPHTDHHFATHSMYIGQNPTTMHVAHIQENTIHEDVNDHPNHNQDKATKSVQPKPSKPKMTEEEQMAYEKTIMENVKKMSYQNLLNSITCCITKSILHDPVVAADGFTYEREAITDWFQNSSRSPMTNQELESLELKPNHAIKSILQLLQQDTNSTETQADKKSNA